MKQCQITFRSVTPAQRGENALMKRGVRCVLQRTPRWMQEQGCGYSLVIAADQAYAAVEILRENSISYRKAYLQKDTGKWEEMAL